eukprot:CAMPEP_0114472724 /NCGR_PEP_ID=MMETSP0104-20121206/12546_1 /TAXON_ID=37642 ORGANISM="Paraphysomonas imperforata, Strain PA2" /NCGR_SAMPLE_ID=MMETSP0104 /ASSEMBLY_ACC=CAM_ASM_000202 /LENGTH=204 /DNA_ID=CAMNT_0001646751 /DNA_START=63 /DNA_END=677 /DNA_ORIENTATION=+
MILRPGIRPALVAAHVSRRRGRGGVTTGRGGAVPPSVPPSKSIALLFHIQTATIFPEAIIHDSTMYYQITVGAIGNCFWEVYCRYSDFLSLHEKITYLITSFEIQAKFPPRHWFSFLFPPTDEEKSFRHKGLEIWLSELISIATGSCRPREASTFDVNQLKDCLTEFLEFNENFANALKSTEEEGSGGTIPSIEKVVAKEEGTA